MGDTILVNRAPVLTLWAAVVAERLGYDPDAALSLGKCLAGLNAQAKGRRLGIYGPPKAAHGGPPAKVGLGEEFWIDLCGRPLPAKNTPDGVRAIVGDKPIEPVGVETYLQGKFGADLPAVRQVMRQLAEAFSPEDLTERAMSLYEQFRPAIPPGVRGWGAKGELKLDLVRSLVGK
jgi:hypothetical protein